MALNDRIIVDLLVNTEKSISSLKNLVVGGGLATAGIAALKKLIGDSVKTYEEAAIAGLKLDGSLRAAGITSKSTRDAFDELAGNIQKTTIFDDDAARSAEALLVSIGGLGEDGVKKILPLIADLANATGKDLVQATEDVSKTLGSSTNALKRQGIEFDNNLKGAARLDAVAKALSEKFGGLSTLVGDSAVGSLKKFDNAMADLKEELGKEFVEGSKPALEFFAKLAAGILDAQKANELATAAFQKDMNARTAVEKAAANHTEIFSKQIEAANIRSQASYLPSGDQKKAFTDRAAALDKEVFQLMKRQEQLDRAAANEEEANKKKAAADAKRLAAQRELNDALDEFQSTNAGKIKSEQEEIKHIQSLIEKNKNNAQVVYELTEVLQTHRDALKSLTDANLKNASSQEITNTTWDEAAAALKKYSDALKLSQSDIESASKNAAEFAAIEAEVAKNNREAAEQEQAGKLAAEAWEAAKNKIEQYSDYAQSALQSINDISSSLADAQTQKVEDDAKDRQDIIDQQKEDALAALQEQYDSGLIYADDYEAKRKAIEDKAANDSKYSAEELSKQKRKIAHDEAIANKALKATEVAIQTAVNIVKAFPNPFEIAAAVVLGALQEAAILAAPIPELAEGGIVKATPGGTVIRAGEAGQDEAIIPLDRINSEIPIRNILVIDGRQFADFVSKGTRDRRILIDRGALV